MYVDIVSTLFSRPLLGTNLNLNLTFANAIRCFEISNLPKTSGNKILSSHLYVILYSTHVGKPTTLIIDTADLVFPLLF